MQHRRVEERGAGRLDQTHQPRQHVEGHQLLEGRPALPLRRCLVQSTHATRVNTFVRTTQPRTPNPPPGGVHVIASSWGEVRAEEGAAY